MPSPFRIELVGVTKWYQAGTARQSVIRNLDWTLHPGQHCVLLGASGSGKSTLINLIAGLDAPNAGSISYIGPDVETSLGQLTDRERTRFRLRHVGVVHQAFHLIPALTVRENVLLPIELAAGSRAQERRSLDLLGELGLATKFDSLPQDLSGGERQRVAIVRALANDPDVILADEPTGNLDDSTSRSVMDVLGGLCHEFNATLLVATHALEWTARADAVVRLEQGQLEHPSPP